MALTFIFIKSIYYLSAKLFDKSNIRRHEVGY